MVLRVQVGRWRPGSEATLCNTLPQAPLGRGEERAFGCPSRGFLAGRTPKSSAPEGAQTRGRSTVGSVLAPRVLCCGLWNVINTRRGSMLCLRRSPAGGSGGWMPLTNRLRAGEEGDHRMRWHHRLHGHEFE